MDKVGYRYKHLVGKFADWSHLALWIYSVFYLSLNIVNRFYFRDDGFFGLNFIMSTKYQDLIFWSALSAVPLLTVVVVVRIGLKHRIAPAEMLMAGAGWVLLLYNLSFVRS